MPVRLDNVPPLATRPRPPRVWMWLGLLLITLLLGLGLTLGFGDESMRQRPQHFWGMALGIPFAAWCVLAFIRGLVHVGVVGAANGWDQAREEDLVRKLRRGRRSQQVLAVSFYTALRDDTDEHGLTQNQALMGDKSALKTQTVRGQAGLACRHSQLPVVLDPQGKPLDDEAMLLRTYNRVLADLARTLQALPAERPLALILEIDCALPQAQRLAAWQQAWSESGIRQTTTLLERRGLDAIDHWLDSHIDDPALLLVVAVQMAPSPPENTAEVAVGLLFGNRRTQTTLRPTAYLHRPEQERGLTADSLEYAARQALNWAPIGAEAVGDVWLSGIDAVRQGDITQVLLALPCSVKRGQGLHDLQVSLGHPGSAAPWVAIAAAAEGVRSEGKPQFIFSGEDAVETRLWSSVVTAALSSESE